MRKGTSTRWALNIIPTLIRRSLLIAVAATAMLMATQLSANAAPVSGAKVTKAAAVQPVKAVSATVSADEISAAKAAGWGHLSWSSSNPTGAQKSPGTAGAATAVWHCDLWVGPVTLPNGTDGDLKAHTLTTCSGAFGIQETRAHFDRSSWSGWRLYASQSNGPLSRNTFLDSQYAVGCGGSGQGTYNYRLVAQGYTTAGGWTSGSAVYVGTTSQRFACGT